MVVSNLTSNMVPKRGAVIADSYSLSAMQSAPSGAGDTGTLGEIRWTSTYIYLCTATDTWVRFAVTAW